MDQQAAQAKIEAIRSLLPVTWKISPKGGKMTRTSTVLSLLPSLICIAILVLSAIFTDHLEGDYGIEISAGTFALVFLGIIFLSTKVYAEYRIDEQGIHVIRKKNPIFISWDRAKAYISTPEGIYYKIFSWILRLGLRPNEPLGNSISIYYFTPKKGLSHSIELIPTRFEERKILSVLRVMLPEDYTFVDFSKNKSKRT